jgi:HEPN domain-containing protein
VLSHRLLGVGRADELALVSTKLEKAADFLLVAELAVEVDAYDAAVSLAVSAAINAADGLCVLRSGTYPSGRNHDEVVGILRKAGFDQVAKTLASVLAVKDKAQYSPRRCTPDDASAAVKRAGRVVGAAKDESKRFGS